MTKKSFRRKIQKVIDGDTLKVSRRILGSQYIRVAGTNAPEKRQVGYMAAKRKLSRLRGKTVTIKSKGRSYGRIVADVIYRRRLVK